MNTILEVVTNNLGNFYWEFAQIVIVILGIIIIRKYKFSGRYSAILGFILLFITMIFSIFQLDYIAGKIAEFVWIVFATATIQEFYHFYKHEIK